MFLGCDVAWFPVFEVQKGCYFIILSRYVLDGLVQSLDIFVAPSSKSIKSRLRDAIFFFNIFNKFLGSLWWFLRPVALRKMKFNWKIFQFCNLFLRVSMHQAALSKSFLSYYMQQTVFFRIFSLKKLPRCHFANDNTCENLGCLTT